MKRKEHCSYDLNSPGGTNLKKIQGPDAIEDLYSQALPTPLNSWE